ncbi:polysaccharide biosynthesis/export family protein [Oscillatoriales cyanobacterium LEGE 11467]|uniref:Polysaccharide biosynthesis/export family protein n=1 Tax=Zarconia navalis LEGE 11467 TaxID=1828826 RepID=A0A928Z8U3_9CYAN|nr:polysaccharide biosynthesis/export family protein [Zarconia navalis]MBE9041033.1 polysaccharide biosynthesis/export family protein [Zarconia navalis LEGE 11467]
MPTSTFFSRAFILRMPIGFLGFLALLLVPRSLHAQLPQLGDRRPDTLVDGAETIDPLAAAYLLGAGDTIALEIFNVPEYSREYAVLLDGTLNLPLIGRVSVAGLSLTEAEAQILHQYTPVLTRPIIQVRLAGVRPLEIGVAGEVTHPGAYQLLPTTDGAGIELPTVTQALQMAAGTTPAAALANVEVRRPSQAGREETIAVDLSAFFRSGDLRQDIPLQDGDTIFVPAATEINTIATRQESMANFAADRSRPVTVAVVGAVNRPGTHTLNTEVTSSGTPTGEASLTQALKTAGGITALADIRHIEVRRQPLTGEQQQLTVDLWALLQTGDLSQDVLLQTGDTIFVPQAEAVVEGEAQEVASATFSPDTIRVNVVGSAVSLGSIEVSPNASIEDAFFAAGGFDDREAQTGSVELIRLNPNGTLFHQKVEIDLEEGFVDGLVLQEGDTLVVRRDRSFTESLGSVVAPLFPALSVFDLLDNIF